MKKFTALALALLLVLSGCGAAEAKADYTEAAADTMDAAVAEENGWTAETAAAPAEEPAAAPEPSNESANYESTLKIIRTGNLSIESETFDQTDAFIRQTVSQYEGILAESSISGTVGSRWASYTVRVPSDSFDQFFYAVSGRCTVTNQTISAEDVTEQYTDLATQL